MSSIRWIVLLILIVGLAWPVSHIAAQTETTAVETLAIDMWPDYDRTAVLVLLTGTFPTDAQFPTTITIPLPPGADLNAVARITDDNIMTDDVTYEESVDGVTFTTPDRRFRVEYYMPYSAVGSQHQFDFTWLADFAVNEMLLAVQQPVAATNMQTQPAAAAITEDSTDGFTYHVLPGTAVPAGQDYTVNVEYTMDEPTLSVEQLPVIAPPVTPISAPISEVSTPESGASEGVDWAILLAVAGGVLILVAVVWQVASNRQKPKRPSKATPAHTPQPGPAKFCHQCGLPLQSGDKFCRSCGTAVKR